MTAATPRPPRFCRHASVVLRRCTSTTVRIGSLSGVERRGGRRPLLFLLRGVALTLDILLLPLVLLVKLIVGVCDSACRQRLGVFFDGTQPPPQRALVVATEPTAWKGTCHEGRQGTVRKHVDRVIAPSETLGALASHHAAEGSVVHHLLLDKNHRAKHNANTPPSAPPPSRHTYLCVDAVAWG